MDNVFVKANRQRGKANRKSGEDFEFRILRKFKKRSDVDFAIRSAGSHTLADILVRYKTGKYLIITCKRNAYMTPVEVQEIREFNERKQAHESLRMYYFKSAKKIAYRALQRGEY